MAKKKHTKWVKSLLDRHDALATARAKKIADKKGEK